MKNFIFHRHLRVLVAALVFVLIGDHNCQAIRLNSNGGYDIVVGVDDSTIEPLNANHFLDEIRLGIEQFSIQLWKATHRRFFINSVDVIIPANWWTISNFDTATWQTLQESEIRIAHDIGAPNVVNPNTCGTSGLYVEVPDNFFKVPRGGRYGPVGKALTNLWARYRFGVWEEHGIPGDTKFPYFYAHPSFEPQWEATGCSNQETTGSFRNIDGEISDRCDAYGSEIPDDDCRFIPSPSNTANSSLMHFHWLDSIGEFCDSKTHNHVAPNRQNLFCGHRSVWEVIRESDDYKSTKTCVDTVDRPLFRVMKESRSPEFYILLDRGATVTPERVLQEVMGALVTFVGIPSLEKINIAVGTYPHNYANQGKNHYYVKEEVGWAPISSVIYDIQSVLGESSTPDGPDIRDFGLAIQEVAEKIKQRNHLAGTIILVIKRGASPNLFDKITFEQEVIASIKEDNRIHVFAIEAQQGEKTPYTNLQTLAEATFGHYHVINDTVNTAKKLERIFSAIHEQLEQSSIMNSLASWTTQKQYTEPETVVEIPIYDNVNTVKVHLTTNRQMVSSDIHLEQLSGEHATAELTEKGEWDENSDLSHRTVFTYTIHNPSPGSTWALRHGCHTEKSSECSFFLVVTAHNNQPKFRISESIFNSKSIKIDVSTSATENNYVDMSDQGFKIVPFAIYAKIEMDSQRVLGLKNVSAFVRLGGEHDNHLGDWIVPLADDGLGLPDISKHDGIYSGTFTPLEDGLYQISVAANGFSEPSGFSTFQDLRIVNHAGSLIQISQQSFGCKNSSKLQCISAVPRGSFIRVQDLRGTVAVANAATFKPGKPNKILDLTATTLPDYHVEFEFTSPSLLGSDDDPEEFILYMAHHVDNFIGSTDLTKVLSHEQAEASGSQVKIKYNAGSKAILFYAVEAVYRGQTGGPSNVVGVVPSEDGSIVPSTTTTARTTSIATSTLPSTDPTTTTEYPWPTTTPTTESPFPTTTDESEEMDDYDSITSTTEATSTTVSSVVTDFSTSTTNVPTTIQNSETTTETPFTTTDNTEETGSSLSSTTQVPVTTTDDFGVIGGSSSTTTEAPKTSTDISGTLGSSTSITTEAAMTTTDDNWETGIDSSSVTTVVPITTTDGSEVTNISSSTTTEAAVTTVYDHWETGIISSVTTDAPITSTDILGILGSSKSATHVPQSTTIDDNWVTVIGSSSTTETPISTTDDSGITRGSTSTTEEVPIIVLDDSAVAGSSSSTTNTPVTTTGNSWITESSSLEITEISITTRDDSEVTGGSSSTTTEESTTATDDSGVIGSTTIATTAVPITTTDNSGVTGSSTYVTTEELTTTTDFSGIPGSSTYATTLVPITTTDDIGVLGDSLSSTTVVPVTTMDDGVIGDSSSTTVVSITTTDDIEAIGDSSKTTTVVPVTTTDNIMVIGHSLSSTTEVPVTTMDDGVLGDSSSTTVVSITTTDHIGAMGDSLSSTTVVPVTTTDDIGVLGDSSSTTVVSITTTDHIGAMGDSLSSTTVVPVTTTDDIGVLGDSSSTTVVSITTTDDDGVIGYSSSTTLTPVTTTDESEDSTTLSTPLTTTIDESEVITGESSTLTPATTTDEIETSTLTSTTLTSVAITEPDGILSVSTTMTATTEESEASTAATTLTPTTTTDESEGDASASPTMAPTTEDSEASTSASTTINPTPTTEDSSSSSTANAPQFTSTSSSVPPTTSTISASITPPDENVSKPSTASSTAGSSSATLPSSSACFKMVSSETLLFASTFSSFFVQLLWRR